MGSGDRPFAPARTWTRQSTEKLQQKMEWHVGCWWSHWLDGVSSASVPSSCISTAGHSTSGLVRCAAVFHSHRLKGGTAAIVRALRPMRRREAVPEVRKPCWRTRRVLGCRHQRIQPQISLYKKKISITSKCWHMHGVLNIDKI
jgi:hypothetical protein